MAENHQVYSFPSVFTSYPKSAPQFYLALISVVVVLTPHKDLYRRSVSIIPHLVPLAKQFIQKLAKLRLLTFYFI